jgi:hypothetical protein
VTDLPAAQIGGKTANPALVLHLAALPVEAAEAALAEPFTDNLNGHQKL